MDLKRATSFEEQAAIIKSRGYSEKEDGLLANFLSRVNYYRFSAYFLPFQNQKIFPTDIESIIKIYQFDSDLRIWLLKVIDAIETDVKTKLAYHIGHEYGPEGYMDESIFNEKHKHQKLLANIERFKHENRKTPVVIHHNKKYDGRFPIWVIIEFFNLGAVSFFYADLQISDQKFIASTYFNTGYKQLMSWLRVLTELRNKCAHFSRLYFWNFKSIPKRDKRFKYETDGTLYSQFIMLSYLYPEKDEWNRLLLKLKYLVNDYDDYIELQHIGFPDDWFEALSRK
ncbi:MAG: Abi family protein [Eubacteriales bacterium]|nr:Abi family protein [Eubacteriales bacterium]